MLYIEINGNLEVNILSSVTIVILGKFWKVSIFSKNFSNQSENDNWKKQTPKPNEVRDTDSTFVDGTIFQTQRLKGNEY